jgi:hypothetical protein
MEKAFKLSEITHMKLNCVRQLNEEISYAEQYGHKGHAEACRNELGRTKYEAMHPQVVADQLKG